MEPEGVTEPLAPPEVMVTGLAVAEASPLDSWLRSLGGVSAPSVFSRTPLAASALLPANPAAAEGMLTLKHAYKAID